MYCTYQFLKRWQMHFAAMILCTFFHILTLSGYTKAMIPNLCVTSYHILLKFRPTFASRVVVKYFKTPIKGTENKGKSIVGRQIKY